jgi:carboxymethylenebutenolidase
MQRYVGEESLEKYQMGLISWSQLLRTLVLIGGSAAAAAALLSLNSNFPSVPEGARALPQIRIVPPNGPLVVAEDDLAITGTPVSFQSEHTIEGYLAQPAQEGRYPGVLVIHEASGLSEHIKDVTRRVAKAGYVAFAPELLSRWGLTPGLPVEKVMSLLANTKPEEILADLNAAVAYLSQQANMSVSGKLGVVGFCFGGAYSLQLAAVNPAIAAAVCYYGVTPQPASQMANTKAAILAHYGALDQRVNATAAELKEVLVGAGKTIEQYYYEGVGHAFNNDTIYPAFKEQAAVLAWERTLDWFECYLH